MKAAWFFTAVAFGWACLPVYGQTGRAPLNPPAGAAPAANPAADAAAVADLLAHGRELEEQNRWGEALSHYEQAVKDHPNHKDLEERLVHARMHYDFQRRHADDSFRKLAAGLDETEASNLYSEALLKIQSHYYGSPNWTDLFRKGLNAFDTALTKDAFQQRWLPDVDAKAIDRFRRELQQSLGAVAPRDHRQAKEHAVWAARAAKDRLGLAPGATLLEFTSGATCALDEYSAFLTPSQLDEVFSQIEGNFVGLGVELKTEETQLLVVSVIPDGPADEGGIRAGERIVSVDGKEVGRVEDGFISSEAAADMLRGEEGTLVAVEVSDGDGQVRSLRLARRRVEVPCVEGARIVDTESGVAYMKLTSFQKTTSRDVDDALWKLYREGMRSLIMDLRGNPGGLLTASVEVADKFVTEGTIVSTRGRSAREDYDYKAHRTGTWRVPLTVLIDGDSASASEIFAGAIRDHRRGKIVGQRSYGKGSVQGIFQLQTSPIGMRLTTAKFYSPNGQEISRRGVTPDIVIRTTAKPTTEGRRFTTSTEIDPTDTALESALSTAKQQAAPPVQQASRRKK